MKEKKLSYTRELEEYNRAWRYMEWESQYKPYNGDNRTKLQKRLDKLSLAEGWNYKEAHYLKNESKYPYNEKRAIEAKIRLESESYKEDNPYKDKGYQIFVGDCIFDEYGFLSRFEGWSYDGRPNFVKIERR